MTALTSVSDAAAAAYASSHSCVNPFGAADWRQPDGSRNEPASNRHAFLE